MNINLHIERLILDGLPLEDGNAPLLKVAVEAELTRLLTAEGLPDGLMAGGALPRVSAGSIQPAGNVSAGSLGQQIARAVYEGIGR